MKLMRLGPPGQERPAAAAGPGRYVDLSDVVVDINADLLGSPERLEVAAAAARQRIEAGMTHDLADTRIGAPVARPHQILCIGLNYADHAAESGMDIPTEPIVFTKAPNTLIGPNDDVITPRGSTKTDWEVELAIIIGARCSYLDTVDQAADHIAGYAVANDVSERASSSIAAVNGARASPRQPSTPWAPGWSLPRRSTTSPTWDCGSTSTAPAGRPGRPPP